MADVDIVQLWIAMIIIVFGCLGNTFIILVFSLEYRTSWTLQPYELIVMLMAVCNLGMELGYTAFFILYLLDLCTYTGETVYKIIHFFTIFLPKTVIWLTACLCFAYCVKIVKVNCRIFMRLKQRLSLAVNCMMIGTLLLTILLSFPVILFIKFKMNSTKICRDYYTVNEEKELIFIYTSLLSFLTSFLPLVLMLVSSLCIVIFLCQHSRYMDKNITPTSTSRSDAHSSVAIMLLCLIALFIACAGTALSVNLQIASGQFDVQGQRLSLNDNDKSEYAVPDKTFVYLKGARTKEKG
nr:PREDICTED: taste receptor type 2 member 7-like [Latimeria chalumnae]|eukprot:XP_006011510.2 PREDICTED: taste receptor type 2 member 7-like [Latimeria chalumnae]